MRRRRAPTHDAPGQDSFLDIVANLVGILIILVMVVGARAKDAMIQSQRQEAAAARPEPIDTQTPAATAAALERDIHEIQAKAKRGALEIAYRRKERDQMNRYVVAVEQELDAQRVQLDRQQQHHLDTNAELLRVQDELQRTLQDEQALEQLNRTPVILTHLPTPMARKVFGKELHLRLSGGRVAYVPWDELVAKLKTEAREKVWKLKDAPAITEIAGPVQGFQMRYQLVRTQQSLQTRMGMAVQTRVELDHFHLIPTSEALGETLDHALSGRSELQRLLDAYDPQHTTITVWVYPDSFDEFRRLKEAALARGFLTAARPMPQGRYIGGSPHGTRASAQ